MGHNTDNLFGNWNSQERYKEWTGGPILKEDDGYGHKLCSQRNGKEVSDQGGRSHEFYVIYLEEK